MQRGGRPPIPVLNANASVIRGESHSSRVSNLQSDPYCSSFGPLRRFFRQQMFGLNIAGIGLSGGLRGHFCHFL